MKNKILQMLLFATIVCSSTLNLSTVMAKTTVYNDNLNLTSGLSKKMLQNIYDSYTEIKIEDVVKVQKMTPVKRTVKENGDIVLRFAVAG